MASQGGPSPPPSPALVMEAVSEGKARGGPLAPPQVGGAPYPPRANEATRSKAEARGPPMRPPAPQGPEPDGWGVAREPKPYGANGYQLLPTLEYGHTPRRLITRAPAP